MKVCPICKRVFPDADVYCPHDGGRLEPMAGAPPSTVTVAPRGGHGIGPMAEADTPPSPVARPGRPVPTTPGTGPQVELLASTADPARPPDPLDEYRAMVGRTLDGRYQLEALLGEGGMGVVFKAHHAVIEKPVAIKLLKREVAAEESVTARFLQEAKAASRIGHPNIVDVTDFGTLPDGTAYFVMEYIAGKTLAHLLYEQSPVPIERTVHIIAQLARALAAAHNKGVVHRDLKPDNIFVVDRDGQHDVVKIVDFGIAKVAPVEGNLDGPRLTRVGSVFGTPEYMAPEQASGRSDLDQRVDVYALGTIFYELVVGHVPHRADSLVAVLAMQILDPVDPPHLAAPNLTLDVGIESVIMTALAKDRDVRFASMAELLGALDMAAQNAGMNLDDTRATSSVRALGAVSGAPLITGKTPPGLPGAFVAGPPPPAPPTPGPTLKEAGATLQDASPPSMRVDTVRVAGPDDRTFAPDPSMLSPFRQGGPGPAGVAAVGGAAPRPTPSPSPSTLREPPAMPGPIPPRPTPAPARGPEAPTVMPPNAASGAPVPMATLKPPAGGNVMAAAGVLPPAARPVPLPVTSDRFAEPLEVRRDGGVSNTAKALLLLLLVATSGVVVWVLVRSNGGEPSLAAASADAGAGLVVPPPSPTGATDAAPGTPAGGPPDAGGRVVVIGPGPGRARPDAGVRFVAPNHNNDPVGPPVTVRVVTSPRGGELATGITRGNPDGTNFTRARGTRLLVECSAPQHRPGTIEVVFDGRASGEAVCKMERLVKCSKELKNPFDPCPE